MQQANAPRFTPAIAAALAALLTGCAPPGQTYAVYDPVPPPVPAAPALPEPQPVVPRVDLDLQDGLPNPANAACMSAVAEQADDFNVRVLGNETVAAGTEVTVGVGEDLTRWRCVAGPGGELVEVGRVGAPLPEVGEIADPLPDEG